MDPIRSLEGDTLDMQQNFFEKDREGICCISRAKSSLKVFSKMKCFADMQQIFSSNI